jgi:hypothetical protein
MDTKEVPQNDPKAQAGVTFDPYSDPAQLVDLHSPLIPFHNYRQIHVSEVAFYAGLHASSWNSLPLCPPLWQDVAHYWDMMAIVGYVAYLSVPWIAGVLGTLAAIKGLHIG